MIFKKIKRVISEQFSVNEESITLETSFQDDLNADSLDLVELVMAMEDEFNLEVKDEDIENMKTVGDVVDYIEKNVDLN